MTRASCKHRQLAPLLPLCLLITGCSLLSMGDAQVDGIPTRPISELMKITEPTPRWEPRSRLGNHSPYEVFGKTYRVLESAEGYREVGIASWYGTKFHGRKTSSGEPYDVYKITAAHKSLPLPTYVQVTNLENGRTLVVRVNDRGPFKAGRIIDLSYAAAVQLGVFPRGTARVRVEAIPVDKPSLLSGLFPGGSDHPETTREQDSYLLQAGAFSTRANAEQLGNQLRQQDLGEISMRADDTTRLVRVLVGPFQTRQEAEAAQRSLLERLGIRAFIVDSD